MSGSVRFVFPKNRLQELIHAPGGITVAEALQQADANLETLKPQSREELLGLLAEAEAAFEAAAEPADTQATLYSIAVRGIGAGAVCGAPDVDGALGSLCDLVDHLQQNGSADRNGLAVHLRAWRLLMDPQLPKPGAAVILEGLRKVTGHFAS
jgi:hypothetical protein